MILITKGFTLNILQYPQSFLQLLSIPGTACCTCAHNIDCISPSQIPNLIPNLDYTKIFHRRKFKRYQAFQNLSHSPTRRYFSFSITRVFYAPEAVHFPYKLLYKVSKHYVFWNMSCSHNHVFRYERINSLHFFWVSAQIRLERVCLKA